MRCCAESATRAPVVRGHPSIERRMIVAKLHLDQEPNLKVRPQGCIRLGWDKNADADRFLWIRTSGSGLVWI
jgi:hypothetical protein